jgi:CheY-like chemotaxis protein
MPAILTVEDEFLVREYLGAVLEEAGYSVIAVKNADEAIATLESRDDIDVVFTDINMPGSMDGLSLAAAVRDRWPTIKLIVTSGKARPGSQEMPVGSRFVSKPAGPEVILSVVRQLV